MSTRQDSPHGSLDAYVQAQVDSGRFDRASEVVRAALEQMQERDLHRETKIAALRGALEAGLASGVAPEGAFARVRAKLGLG